MSAVVDKIEGLTRLSDFFGFVPDFHDWTITSFAWQPPQIRMEFDAFRMTSQVDGAGHFVCDRRARVTVNCQSVSAWDVRCGEGGIVGSVRWVAVRDIPSDARARLKLFCAGPGDEDIAFELEPAYGIEGWITCERIAIDVEPLVDEDKK